MALVPPLQGSNNTGTVSPATPGSLTTTVGNMLLLIVAVAGTNPTITDPANWTVIQKRQGSTVALAVYEFPGNTGGATNPSVVLGGTVTGWGACMFEIGGEGGASQYEVLEGSVLSPPQSVTNLPNIFPVGPLPLSNLLFMYVVARATATLTPNNGVLPWTATQQAMSANGVAIDTFFATNPGPSPFPTAAGTLSAGVVNLQVGAWFSSINSSPIVLSPAGGMSGVYVGQFNQGMIGG